MRNIDALFQMRSRMTLFFIHPIPVASGMSTFALQLSVDRQYAVSGTEEHDTKRIEREGDRQRERKRERGSSMRETVNYIAPLCCMKCNI